MPGSGQPEGSVVAELQRGYRVRDRVLRPAMVAVARRRRRGGRRIQPDDPTDGAGPLN